MNEIKFTLKAGDKSAAVANLQDALLLLLNRVALMADDDPARRALTTQLKDEQGKGAYGDVTRNLVKTFQKERNLKLSEKVDRATARALNELLRKLRALPAKLESVAILDSPYAVECRAVDAKEKPIAGLRIVAFDQDPVSPDDPLGEPGITDTKGLVLFRFKRSDFTEHPDEADPDLYFKVYRGETSLDYELPGIPNDKGVIRRFKQQREPIVVRVKKHYVVTGVVMHANRLPADKLELFVHRIDFGEEPLLGRPTTDFQGRYTLAYDPGASAVNLDIRVKDPRDTGETVPLIKPRFAAAPLEVLNLIAPNAALSSEYERLSADLKRHLGRKDLSQAREKAERRDLTVLNRATGWDARLIALQAITERLCAEVQLPQEAVYGLLRTGLPSDKSLLAQVNPEVAEQALKAARGAGIIAISDEQIKLFKEAFSEFRNKARLDTATPGSRSTYDELLKASGLEPKSQDEFNKVYLKHGSDPAELWNKARAAGLSVQEIGKLKLQGKVAYLVGNSAAMTARLMKKPINNPAQLVEGDLYSGETWIKEVLDQSAIPYGNRNNLTNQDKEKLDRIIPTAYSGARTEDRLKAYTEDMARKVRMSYPTQVVARLIEKNEIKLPAARAATVTLLRSAAGEGFRLGSTPVPKFFKTHTGVFGDLNAADVQAAQQQITTLHCVYQATRNDKAAAVLMELKIYSCHDLVRYSQSEFSVLFNATHLAHFGQPAAAGLADQIFRKAQQVGSVTLNLFTIAKQLEQGNQPAALSVPAEVRERARQELIKQYPNLETLFGSMDFCACEHCRSVLSPAAYLVDLFQFLDPEQEEWQKHHPGAKKPYDVLIGRRPDLPHIQLTCANTLTAMPYIDIVNEILEYFVAHSELSEQAAQNTGQVSTAELLAEPQNVISGAYLSLRDALYPHNLPFDLPIEIVRQFCDYFETPLGRILEVFRKSSELFEPAQSFDWAKIFLEGLGFSPVETAVFKNPDPLADLLKLYGFANPDDAAVAGEDPETRLRAELHSAKALANRLGVTYRELAEIVETEFVNPELHRNGLRRKLEMSIENTQFFLRNQHLLLPDFKSLSEDQKKIRLELDAYKAKLESWAARYSVPYQALLEGLSSTPFQRILHLDYSIAGCDFDKTILRYADGPEAAVRPAQAIDFLRLNLFVRLWRKLGWSIEETDRALRAFIPSGAPFDADPANLRRQPLMTALIYLSHLKTLDEKLRLGKQGRLKLLTLWSDLATTGKDPLYEKLFLVASVLRSDPVFDDAFGRYLTNSAHKVNAHMPALQGALGLTADEIRNILKDARAALGLTDAEVRSIDEAGADPTALAALSVRNVSWLYKYGLLARALKLSVADLIALKRMSGLEPFRQLEPDPLTEIPVGKAMGVDYPFTQTLRFVEVAEAVTASGLKIEELDYLFWHRFEETGKFRPNREVILNLLKTLADGIRLILAEHAEPAEPGSIAEEVLSQKLGLALPADVVATFLSMMNGTAEFTGTTTPVAVENQLRLADFSGEPAISQLAYNAIRREQSVVFRGVLFDTQKTELKTRFNGLPAGQPPAGQLPEGQRATFSEVLDDVQKKSQEQALAFFTTHLQKQSWNATLTSGFLDPADFELLLDLHPTLVAGETGQSRARTRREKLVKAFFPFLRQRLIRQFVVQTLAAHTSADVKLVESLLTDKVLVALSNLPLLDFIVATSEPGVTASFFASTDGHGNASRVVSLRDANTGLKDPTGNPLRPAGSQSARLEGYLEVPAPGAYRFYAVLDKQDAQATLKFAHLPTTTMSGTAAAHNAEVSVGEFVELLPGILYQYSLELKSLGGGEARLLVQGETLSKGPLSQLRLYPLNVMSVAERAIIRLTKALRLVQSLGLTEREIRYLSIHPEVFDGFNLRQLPTRPLEDTLAARSEAIRLFKRFLLLAAYVGLKRDLAGGTDDLIAVFEAQRAGGTAAVYPLLAKLTRREEATVRETAQALFDAPVFDSESALRRWWDALQVVARFGVPVASLVKWTGVVAEKPRPTTDLMVADLFEIARDVRETIKARFEPDAWLRVAQPIFDRLRQRQRDALTSHLIHKMKFERLEQLYEYFLIDPGMEPVVQTSRIRLAIASVQLFIQRCLLNLEPEVQPSLIKSEHWEWMKRYRVWEANRKIFLFPENWLEPEFRDDKTHLFAEIEGALLQGDVSSDLVEDAFLTYLKKLDELARLDIVGLHIEDDDGPNPRTLHVFGRTFSQPHKYFYRRFRDSWTPWEPVSAEIEGDHLAPVVWRDRLFLFWVTFLEKATEVGEQTLKIGAKIEKPKKNVGAQLHWSQYINGEWSTSESSGFNTSQRLWAIKLSNFHPWKVFIHVSKVKTADGEGGVYIHLSSPINRAFFLAGRNSTPERRSYEENGGVKPTNVYNRGIRFANRYIGLLGENLSVTSVTEADNAPPDIPILQQGNDYRLTLCDNNLTVITESGEVAPEIVTLLKPFFCQDNRNTFFVEPTVTERTIDQQDYIRHPPERDRGWEIMEDDPRLEAAVAELEANLGFIDPDRPIQDGLGPLINPVRGNDWLTNPVTVLIVDGQAIGPRGLAGINILPAGGLAEGQTPVHVNPGSGRNAGATVVLDNGATLAGAGLTQAPGGLNVVGSAGFNTVLAQNFDEAHRSGFAEENNVAEVLER